MYEAQLSLDKHGKNPEEAKEEFKLELAACKYLKQQLSTMRTKLQKRRDATVSERMSRVYELLGEYNTLEEAHEDFGYDFITEEEYKDLEEAFESGEIAALKDDVDSLAVSWLNRFIKNLNDEIYYYQYALMSPKEQEAYDKKIAKWEKEQEKRRKRLGR